MTVKAGDTVEGRYKILKELDHGGMGTVFLAEHHLIKRRVALKLLRADLAEDVDVLERFMNEARVAGTLGHPNIVESTDMGFTRDGVPYIVFELLEGSLLTDEIYRTHGFPVRRALRIARQIASALAASHSAGVVHRDLKTDNIFLTDRDDAADHVKVLDFGVSQFIGEDTKAGASVVGTPQFMAPEQIAAPDGVDARVDIYALGVILYEMLAARRPFADDADPNVVFQRILHEAPAPLGVENLPAGLEILLFERFITKNRDLRFQTMRDAEGSLAAFAGIVRPEGSRDSVPIPALMAPTPLPHPVEAVALPRAPARRGPSPIWLIAAVLAAAGGIAAIASGDRGPTAGAGQATPADAAVVRDDAGKLASAIDATMRAAQMKADGLAQTPMLRAAVETDAKTVDDMLRSEYSLKLEPGEAFEMSQLRRGKQEVLARQPPGDPLAITDHLAPTLHVVDKRLTVEVAAALQNPGGKVAGAIALSVPVDLIAFRSQTAGHASDVALSGIDGVLPLVPAAGSGTRVEARVELGSTLARSATLSETIPVAATAAAGPGDGNNLRYVAFAAWGSAGFLAVIYIASLLRGRRRV